MSINVEAELINLEAHTRKREKETVAIEEPTNIYLNEEYLVTLLSTPTMRKELAIGWLLSEGILHSFSEIKNITVSGSEIEASTKRSFDRKDLKILGVTRLYTTACGLSTAKFNEVISAKETEQIRSDYRIKAKEALRIVKELENGAVFFRKTGGTHVSALFERGKLVMLAEDVGRHNSVDKVIGSAAQTDTKFSECVLASSGRQPADMVLKAARTGIPIIVSKAAPIRSGIIAAEKWGVTLVCFARKNRMNVYSHPFRIE